MDASGLLVTLAVRALPADRAGWGQAMIGELAEINARSLRRRFALGCLRAALVVPSARRSAGRGLIRAVMAAALASLALVVLAVVQYPRLIVGARTWFELAFFAIVLAIYAGVTAVLVRRLDEPSASAVSIALLAALPIAVLWLSVGLVASFDASAFVGTATVCALVLVPLAVGAVAAWRGRDVRAGRRAVALCAPCAGLLVFLAWAGEAVFADGRPYDAGMLRDFHSSGSPDLATYALSDNLGTAMMLLLIVPMVSFAFGLAGAALAGRSTKRPRSTRT